MRPVDVRPQQRFTRRDMVRFGFGLGITSVTPLAACARPDAQAATSATTAPSSKPSIEAPKPAKEAISPLPELRIPTPPGYRQVAAESNKITFMGARAKDIDATIVFSSDPAYRGEPLKTFAFRRINEDRTQLKLGEPFKPPYFNGSNDDYAGNISKPVEALTTNYGQAHEDSYLYYAGIWFIYRGKGFSGYSLSPAGIQQEAYQAFYKTYRNITLL